MRKTAAILLLMLIVFNTIGYKLWFNIAVQQADVTLEASLDNNNYTQQDLFTLKIPLNLPYQNIGTGFERINGEITINGECYKYVQRKVQDDTLFLQCIRHSEKINLEQHSNDYFGKVNDIAGNSHAKKTPGKNSILLKFCLADFITHEKSISKQATYIFVNNIYGSKACINNSLTHNQKLIKPPQSV